MNRVALLFDRTYIDAHHCFMELANCLVTSGKEVDLYMIDNPYNHRPFFDNGKVRVFPFPLSKWQKLEYWSKIRFAKDRRYTAIIATPVMGAWVARETAKIQKIPYYYLADELIEHLLASSKTGEAEKTRLAKRNYLANRSAAATIALGEERYTEQKRQNRIDYPHDHIIIPNAPAGAAGRMKSHYFRDLFHIEDRKPIFLFAGTLQWQLAKKLYEETRSYTDRDYHVIFHARTLGLMGEEAHPFIKISNKPIPSSMMNYAVSSADIGLALYDKNSPHETRNGITGGKIGAYLKNELPLLIGSAENLKFFETAGVGLYWDGETAFDAIAKKAVANIDRYRRNIPPFYQTHLQYEVFFEKLNEHMSR